MRKNLAALCLACLCVLGAHAESGFLDFSSAQILASGEGSASLDSPQGVLLNPAVSAGEQRVVLDLSWIPLFGLGASSQPGWVGSVINGGVTIPTRAGVFSTSARVASASFNELSWGTFGTLNVSFAKDLFPKLWIGVGLGGAFGGGPLGLDWGLGADLGFLHMVGDLGAFKDFRWGVALRNMGKGYAYSITPGVFTRPPVFTPAVGAAFSLVRTDALRLSFSPELSFPSFQDLRASLGMEFGVADIFFLDMSGVFDLRQALGAEPARDIPLTFGASLKLNKLKMKAKGFEVNELKTTIAAAPMQDGIWAIGAGVNVPFGLRDTTPPQITLDTSGERYISPNFDGIKDDLVLDLVITDTRFVKGYRFVIQDSVGTAVRTILNKEDRPENRDIKGIWSRLIYVKQGIAVPPTIRWDGKSDTGAVVPDGVYRYIVEAWDDNENLGKTATGTVIVDNTPPSVTRERAVPHLLAQRGREQGHPCARADGERRGQVERGDPHDRRRRGESAGLGERGAPELRVGRQGQRRHHRSRRRVWLHHHGRGQGGQHRLRDAGQHHRQHRGDPGAALDRPLVLLAQRGRREGCGQLRHQRPGNGHREMVARHFRREGRRAQDLLGHAVRPRHRGLGRQGRRGRRAAGRRLHGEARCPVRERQQPQGRLARHHDRRHRADRCCEGRIRDLLAQRRRQQGRRDHLPGLLGRGVLDGRGQGRGGQGRADDGVAGEGRREVGVGRSRRHGHAAPRRDLRLYAGNDRQGRQHGLLAGSPDPHRHE